LVFDDRSTTTARVAAVNEQPPVKSTLVQTTTLDALTDEAGLRSIELLKIDVEGSESDVIDGGPLALGSCRSVTLEYHGAIQLAAVRARLIAVGFEEVFVSPTHIAFIRPAFASTENSKEASPSAGFLDT
jgi:hypothetical protein